HDSATGALITGGHASLYHNGQLVSTLEMGTGAVWEHLGTGHYSFSISHDGYPAKEFSIDDLTCDEHRNVERTWGALHEHNDCCDGVLEYTITDASTGHALSGALVTITNGSATRTA